jgi:carboxyl-terminal processing protease
MNVGFPDVCATPPMGAPIPYPNMALNATMVPFAIKTYLSCVNALNLGSQAPTTLGDQAGTMSPFMGPGRCTMGNPKVYIEALPGTNLLCPSTGNNMINALGAVVVPSVTNVFFTRAGAAPRGDVDADTLSALSRALQPAEGEEASTRLPGDIVRTKIPVFSMGVASRIHDLLRRSAARALILDLRGCPGGDLSSALDLASDFLAEGTILATVVDGDGDETVHRSNNEHPHALPVALLVDRGTASAAEVFAGCLKAHGRAVVIGERTYGKGTAQALVSGFHGPGAQLATVASVLLPDGEPIEGRGVCPDIAIDG